MLQRIKLIKNIGKFYDCQPPGVGFGKETVIYGRNGDGKSTLTAIFRSLATGNIAILKGRKSFGASGNKKIELVVDTDIPNQDIVFQNLSWNRLYEKIHIFDSNFIYDNIYEGESIEASHRSNLHRVIIGIKGKSLINELENFNKDIRSLEQRKKELFSEFNGSAFGSHFSIDDFVSIPSEDSQIDKKIKEKDQEIVFASQLSKPGIINISDSQISHLRTALEKDFKTTHDKAESEIMKHIETHWKDTTHSKMYIKDGLSLVTDINNLKNVGCPFCGQSLLPVTNLIKNYQDYFNDEHKKFRESLIQEVDAFEKLNIDNIVTAAEYTVSSWRLFLGEEYSDNVIKSLKDSKVHLLQYKTIIEEECDKKIADLNYKVDLEKLDEFSKEFENLEILINKHNENVKTYLAHHSGKAVDDLKREIGKLRAIKARYSEKWIKYATEHKDVVLRINEAKRERDKKISEISSYTKDIFDKHQLAINNFLKEMGVDFKIVEFCEQKDLRRAEGIFCGYEIEFFSQDRIPLDDVEDRHSIKNCLSQGDKSALAFAFFLSVISNDDELEKKIVIFDDPVSSFDIERKRKTTHLLLDFVSQSKKRPKQLIIMTHEIQFLRNLFDAANQRDVRYIKIKQDGITSNGRKKSTIEYCDVYEEFFQAKEVKQLKRIKRYADGNELVPEEARADCRNVIEAVFKIKYYLELEEEIKNNQSVRSFLNKLCEINMPAYDQAKKERLSRLFNDLHVPHHSGITQAPSETSTGDLRSILKDTLQELQKL